jgi:hypothetical protein
MDIVSVLLLLFAALGIVVSFEVLERRGGASRGNGSTSLKPPVDVEPDADAPSYEVRRDHLLSLGWKEEHRGVFIKPAPPPRRE